MNIAGKFADIFAVHVLAGKHVRMLQYISSFPCPVAFPLTRKITTRKRPAYFDMLSFRDVVKKRLFLLSFVCVIALSYVLFCRSGNLKNLVVLQALVGFEPVSLQISLGK